MLSDNVKFLIEGNKIKSLDGKLVKRLSYAEIAILTALIDAKGEPVSRDILISLGWPGKIVVPNSLNMAVLSLRRSLDALGLSEHVVTVPRFGFLLAQHNLFQCVNVHENIISDADADADAIIYSNLLTVDKKNHETYPLHITEPIGLSSQKTDVIRESKQKLKYAVIVSLCLFNFFVLSTYNSHTPRLVCDTFYSKTIVCANSFDDNLRDAIKIYLSKSDFNDVRGIFAEKNPHHENGYKFYLWDIE
ncbi:transcriptional regulator [Aeromonas sp. R5-4]|uniref:transcriptional regulator n=1 Tax=Aeromonas sp. R5-4 TaxID=3138470 RepID=UPI0034A5A8E9